MAQSAHESIQSANRALLGSLPFDDVQDMEDADRGFLGALEPAAITTADGRVVWDADAYGFLAGEAPPTQH